MSNQRMFCKTHEWLIMDGEIATIGLTDFAQKELGDIVYVSLPDVGDAVKVEQSFGEVESVKAVSDMFSPVSGTVTDVNDTLADEPEQINKAPYETWLVRVRVTQKGELLTEAQYLDFVKKDKK